METPEGNARTRARDLATNRTSGIRDYHSSTMSAQPRRVSQRILTALLAASIGIAPTLPAQTNLPDLGDPAQAFMSTVRERKVGEAAMREVRGSGVWLNDPEVNGYLNELGNRLVTAIPGAGFDFEFFAMNDPTINAFALPGGFVGVNTGLILLAQNESELASVLAHEISHVTQHHLTRSVVGQQRSILY